MWSVRRYDPSFFSACSSFAILIFNSQLSSPFVSIKLTTFRLSYNTEHRSGIFPILIHFQLSSPQHFIQARHRLPFSLCNNSEYAVALPNFGRNIPFSISQRSVAQ